MKSTDKNTRNVNFIDELTAFSTTIQTRTKR